jgi:hypothetical protein
MSGKNMSKYSGFMVRVCIVPFILAVLFLFAIQAGAAFAADDSAAEKSPDGMGYRFEKDAHRMRGVISTGT